jgi:peptidoglycan/LPS O-acetylase OafA/YrhL
LWSLAQEEQFYLLAPLALLLVFRRRLSPLVVMWLLGGLLVAVTAEAIVLSRGDIWSQRVYVGPDTHSGGLLVGMLLAFALQRTPRWLTLRRLPFLDVFSLLVFVPCAIVLMPFAFQSPFVYLAAMGLVCCAVCQPRSAVTRLLSTQPIVAIGKISYSLYLSHVFMLWLFGWHDRGLALACAFVIAYASTRWVEEPIRRRRRAPVLRLARTPAMVQS